MNFLSDDDDDDDDFDLVQQLGPCRCQAQAAAKAGRRPQAK
jgi:hypothetical protein